MSDKDIKWFHSKEGEKAFRDATTLQSRIIWIYQYLSVLSQDNDPKSLLKLAYIMADQMWDSPHRFSGWPNIIDKDCNPFLNLVENGEIQDFRDLPSQFFVFNQESLKIKDNLVKDLEPQLRENVFGEHIAYKLLCALHNKQEGLFPYKELKDYQEDKTIYSIEREIIWLFCYNGQITYNVGPYKWGFNDEQEKLLDEELKASYNKASKVFNDYKSVKIQSREMRSNYLAHQRNAEDKKGSKIIIAVALIAAIVLLGVFVSTQNNKRTASIEEFNNDVSIANDNEMIDETDGNVDTDKEAVIGYAEVIVDELFIRNMPSTEGNTPKYFAEQNQLYEVFDIYYDGQLTWYKVGNEEWFADDDGKWVVFTPSSSN